MESRNMEIRLISARDLKKTSIFSKTNAFAVAWISNNHKNRQWTAVDKENGTNPNWNQVMNFTLNEADLQHEGRLVLEIVIYRTATFGDKEIGRVSIPLKEFLKPSGGKKGARAKFVSYQVRKPSGKPKGVLDLSVKFPENAEVKLQQAEAAAGSYGTAKPEIVTAYSAYPPAGCLSQPPANIQYPSLQTIYPPPYPPANNQCPPPQPMYPPPPPYYQSYHPPYYQVYPPYQGYSLHPGYSPIVS